MFYKFKLKGHLDSKWCAWLATESITNETGGNSCFISNIKDQSALFGLLRKIRDMGLPLLSMNICYETEGEK